MAILCTCLGSRLPCRNPYVYCPLQSCHACHQVTIHGGSNLNCVGHQEEQHPGGGGQCVQRDGRHRRLLHPHLGLRPPRLHQIPRCGTAGLLSLLSGLLLSSKYFSAFLPFFPPGAKLLHGCYHFCPAGSCLHQVTHQQCVLLTIHYYCSCVFYSISSFTPLQELLATLSTLILHQVPCGPCWNRYEPGKL